jgi:16S rRNA (uracil1498-N3)-methyltransferase
MNRFFYSAEQLSEGLVILPGEEARHLSRVLRAKAGERVELCDGNGLCRAAVIVSLDKSRVVCRPEGEPLPDNEPSIYITLAFGITKGEKTDLVVQKATELGVSALAPFYSERSVPRPDLRKEAERTERWRRIARSAAAQSRRNRVPAVLPPVRWQDLPHSFAGYDRVILFFEGEGKGTLRDALAEGKKVLLITGPEGGFTASEAVEAQAGGAAAVTLGPRILRAETAAFTAVALVLYQAGEMGGRR